VVVWEEFEGGQREVGEGVIVLKVRVEGEGLGIKAGEGCGGRIRGGRCMIGGLGAVGESGDVVKGKGGWDEVGGGSGNGT